MKRHETLMQSITPATVMTLWSLLITLTDSEGPGQRHLTQAADLQSQQE